MEKESKGMKNSNVLVTGGSGFIGANLIKKLLELGANVRATLHNKDAVVKDGRVEYLKLDLLDFDDCKKAANGMDYVFHCAANTSGAGVTASTPLVYVTPNIIMNAQMLEAAYMAGIDKFIWISSNCAYPPSGSRHVKEEEFFCGEPYDVYYGAAWMKRYTEKLCMLYSEKLNKKMTTVVVRPSNMYGPLDDFDLDTSHMMAATIRKVVERHNPIKIWGDGNTIRDLIYIDDFINALILAAVKIERYYPVNIGYGKGYSVKEILDICLEIDNYKDARVEYDLSKPSMIHIRNISIEKAKKVLGFEPTTDIMSGIAKTMEWFKKEKILTQ